MAVDDRGRNPVTLTLLNPLTRWLSHQVDAPDGIEDRDRGSGGVERGSGGVERGSGSGSGSRYAYLTYFRFKTVFHTKQVP